MDWLSIGCDVNDPYILGVDVTKRASGNGKEQQKDERAKLVEVLQKLTRQVYLNLLGIVMAAIEPILIPAVLDQHPDLLENKYSVASKLTSRTAVAGLQFKNTRPIKTAEDVVEILAQTVSILRDQHHLAPTVLTQFILQVFHSIDVFLFNTFIKNEKFCSCSNGFRIKLGLSQLVNQELLAQTILLFPIPGRNQHKRNINECLLRYTAEAANCLVVDKKVFELETASEVCPHLNPLQVLHLLNAFHMDDPATTTDKGKATAVLRRLVAESGTSLTILQDSEAYLTYKDMINTFC